MFASGALPGTISTTSSTMPRSHPLHVMFSFLPTDSVAWPGLTERDQ
jgi:hypothetical protein